MVYYFLAFESGDLTATVKSLVDCLKRKDGLFVGISQLINRLSQSIINRDNYSKRISWVCPKILSNKVS